MLYKTTLLIFLLNHTKYRPNHSLSFFAPHFLKTMPQIIPVRFFPFPTAVPHICVRHLYVNQSALLPVNTLHQ